MALFSYVVQHSRLCVCLLCRVDDVVPAVHTVYSNFVHCGDGGGDYQEKKAVSVAWIHTIMAGGTGLAGPAVAGSTFC